MPKHGYRQTEEHRRKRAEALSGRTLSEDHRANISQAMHDTYRDGYRETRAERDAKLRRALGLDS